MELEVTDLCVIWDGTHGNQDADLLCCPPVPVKRPGLSEARPVSSAYYPRVGGVGPVSASVLACLQQDALTQRELVQVTGFSQKSIQNAIDRLQRWGLIRSSAAPGGRLGRVGRAYWAVEA